MPIPESATVAAAFRDDLSILAQEYRVLKAAARFIGMRAAPIFRVAENAGEYPTFNRDSFKKTATSKRAANGSYNRITGTFGRATYNTEEYGLEYTIDDKTAKKYVRFFSAEQVANRVLNYQMLKNHEERVSALYAGGGWTNTNVTTAWTTVATATPIGDIQTGVDTLMDKTGAAENDISIIIPRADWKELNLVDQFTEKYSSTFSRNQGIQPGLVRAADAAEIFGVKEVIIANSAKDTTEENVAETNSQIWAAGVIYICILADGEGAPLEEMSAARTIVWDAETPGMPTMEAYREENLRRGIVRAREETDEILQGATDLFVYQLTNT